MSQNDLYDEVARATGESLETVASFGFSLLVMPPPPVIVDHRVRLRQRTRRTLKVRETPARKPKTVTPPASGATTTRRTAA